MQIEHDPYACPVCLSIGSAATKFPTQIRLAFAVIGIISGAVFAGWLGVLAGLVVGLIAAEIIGAAVVQSIRVWLRRCTEQKNDPEWQASIALYLRTVRNCQRRSDAVSHFRYKREPVTQYRPRR